jgi:hypothetical protein
MIYVKFRELVPYNVASQKNRNVVIGPYSHRYLALARFLMAAATDTATHYRAS